MVRERCDLGIASEGSFGPHPLIPFSAANEEYIILIDLKNSLEVVAKVLSPETNYDQLQITTEEELNRFASNAGFPSHGVILKFELENRITFLKDLLSWNDLSSEFRRMINAGGKVWAETDMRAMRNPLRQRIIKQVAEKLLKKIRSVCPRCSAPGFDIIEGIPGLPCKLCHAPTRSVKTFKYACNSCGYNHLNNEEEKSFEDPRCCDVCNP